MTSSTDASAGREIRVPRETVNDDVVIVAAWHVEHGAHVRSGDLVVDVETSKSVLELPAETEGHLEILHPAGSEVPVGELIGRISPQPVAAQSPATAGGATTREPAAEGSDYTISKKARRLVDEHGIDPTVFAGKGLIREVDVVRHLEGRVDVGPSEAPPPPAPAPSEGPKRGVFGDARSSAGDRGKSVVWLAWNYFWRNWLLGNLVKVAPRGVILVLHKMRGVKMGRDCFIDPTATLETAYPENVTLGDDVRITVGAIIMTHIKAPHYLRETGIVPVTLAPVVLEDHCFIGVNAVVMPGVTVGRASVVASGSVAVADVPPYTMVSGIPARVIKRFPKPESEKG